jgi:hypothetical protein
MEFRCLLPLKAFIVIANHLKPDRGGIGKWPGALKLHVNSSGVESKKLVDRVSIKQVISSQVWVKLDVKR